MNTKFYTTFKTSMIDSILMNLNVDTYGTIEAWNDETFNSSAKSSDKNAGGYHFRDQMETIAAWRPLTKENRDKHKGNYVFTRNQQMIDASGQPLMVNGRNRNGKAPRIKSIDQCVYDWMDAQQLNASINGVINYEKEYVAPSFTNSKNKDRVIVEILMLYKWIAGRMLINYEAVQITPETLKQFELNESIKLYFGFFRSLLNSYCATNTLENNVWTIKLTKPAAAVSLLSGPGQINIDYISPNNRHIFEHITKDHEEYKKIIDSNREGERKEETSRLSTTAHDTRMVF